MFVFNLLLLLVCVSSFLLSHDAGSIALCPIWIVGCWDRTLTKSGVAYSNNNELIEPSINNNNAL